MMIENTKSQGIICFTFDDSHYSNWIKAMPLFEQYQAEATFFFSGTVDQAMLDGMKELQRGGHSIGLHTLTHADAPPYFQEQGQDAYINNEILPQYQSCIDHGITVQCFAYPNNRRTAETDHALQSFFKLYRAGAGSLNHCVLSEHDPLFRDPATLQENRVMASAGIGEYYHSNTEDLLNVIRRASRENKMVSFFSHDIRQDAPFIHMPLQTLELCLKEARLQGCRVLGFDSLIKEFLSA